MTEEQKLKDRIEQLTQSKKLSKIIMFWVNQYTGKLLCDANNIKLATHDTNKKEPSY